MPTTLRDIQAALQRKTSFEVIDASENDAKTQLRLMGRLIDDKMGVNLANWHLLIVALSAGRDGWTVDISKKYFERQGKPVYSWRLIFQAEDLPSKYDSIVRAVMGTPHAARGELTEFPLAGARPDRNELVGGKGAVGRKGY